MSWRRIRAVARRHLYVLARDRHRLFDVTVWPFVDTLLFGSLAVFFANQSSAAGLAAGYLLAGAVLWHVLYQPHISVTTGFLEEAWSRQILSLMVTPLTEGEYVVGVALFGLVKLALGVALAMVTAAALYAFNVFTLGLALLPIVAVLMVVGWVVALFTIGLILRFGSGAEVLAWGILFVIMPLSGVFYPTEALPMAVRPLAPLLPTTHAFAAARTAVDGGGIAWGRLGIAATTTALAAAAVLLFLRRMLATFRARGYINRYV